MCLALIDPHQAGNTEGAQQILRALKTHYLKWMKNDFLRFAELDACLLSGLRVGLSSTKGCSVTPPLGVQRRAWVPIADRRASGP